MKGGNMLKNIVFCKDYSLEPFVSILEIHDVVKGGSLKAAAFFKTEPNKEYNVTFKMGNWVYNTVINSGEKSNLIQLLDLEDVKLDKGKHELEVYQGDELLGKEELEVK